MPTFVKGYRRAGKVVRSYTRNSDLRLRVMKALGRENNRLAKVHGHQYFPSRRKDALTRRLKVVNTRVEQQFAQAQRDKWFGRR